MLSFTATHSTTSKDIQFNLYGIEFSAFYDTYIWIQSVKDLIGRLMSNKYAFSNPPAGIKMVSSQNEYSSRYELSEFLINQLFSSNERSFKWKYSEPFPMHGNKILTKNLARQNSSINYFAVLLLQKDLWKQFIHWWTLWQVSRKFDSFY